MLKWFSSLFTSSSAPQAAENSHVEPAETNVSIHYYGYYGPKDPQIAIFPPKLLNKCFGKWDSEHHCRNLYKLAYCQRIRAEQKVSNSTLDAGNGYNCNCPFMNSKRDGAWSAQYHIKGLLEYEEHPEVVSDTINSTLRALNLYDTAIKVQKEEAEIKRLKKEKQSQQSNENQSQ